MIIKSSLWFHQSIFDQLICWFSTSNNNASQALTIVTARWDCSNIVNARFLKKNYKECDRSKKKRSFWILDIVWKFWREIDVILIKISSMQIKYVHKTKFYMSSILRFVEPATLLLGEGFREWYDHTVSDSLADQKTLVAIRKS